MSKEEPITMWMWALSIAPPIILCAAVLGFRVVSAAEVELTHIDGGVVEPADGGVPVAAAPPRPKKIYADPEANPHNGHDNVVTYGVTLSDCQKHCAAMHQTYIDEDRYGCVCETQSGVRVAYK